MNTVDAQAICMFYSAENKAFLHSYPKLSNSERADRK